VHYRVRLEKRDTRHTADFWTTSVDTAVGSPLRYAQQVQYPEVFLHNEVA
jgi:hypothetical protein